MTARPSGLVTEPATGASLWQLSGTPAFLGFLAYVFVIMTYRLPAGTFMMAASLGSLLLQREPIRMPRFFWIFVAWTAWACVGYVVTEYPDAVQESLIERGKLLLVTLVAVNALRTWALVRYFMVFMLASYLLFPARSTLMNYVTGNTLAGRAIGPFLYSNPNDLAALTILMLGPALALWAAAARRSWIRWMGLAGAAMLTVLIVLTQSRAAFIALAAMALPSSVALARRRPRAVVVLAGLLGFALYVAPPAFWERLRGLRTTTVQTTGQTEAQGSTRQRYEVLQNAMRIIRDHPVLGVGLGAYGLANFRYNPALGELDTHNTYLNVLAETGVLGLVLYLAIVASVIRSARDARRRAARMLPTHAETLRWLQYAFVGHLIAGLFGSFSMFVFPWVFIALLWSASRAVRALCPPAAAGPQPIVSAGSAANADPRRRWHV